MDKSKNISSKNYGVSVSLCGIFGMLGIHHFYIGNWLHGFFDLLLLIFGVVLYSSSEQPQEAIGAILLMIDAVHTVLVFYKLIVENQKDGDGKLIVYYRDENS
jgi:hypothetical protein